MNFQESVEYLLSLGNEVTAIKLGLANIQKLLNALGDPHTKYLKVQVAGTNGKGSVCAFLNSICLKAGINTGMYTSPHLVSITERVRINGTDISEEDFARLATQIRETSERLFDTGEIEYIPTFFEQVTALALAAFAEAGVELAILETGLGGRLDATTAANAEIAVITRIDIDHQQYLGETIEEIAAEKAAIIHENSMACVGRQQPQVSGVIKKRCDDLGIVPVTLEKAKWARHAQGYDFLIDRVQVIGVEIPLPGDHQVENAALAILVADQLNSFFRISEKHIAEGIESTRHPGRLELVKLSQVEVLLDGAHNSGGAEALAAYLKVDDPEAISVALLFAAMDDKNVSTMLSSLVPHATDLVVTQLANTRSMSAEKIAMITKDQFGFDRISVVPDVRHALKVAIETASAYRATRWRLVVVTGSLYLVGEVKRLLQEPEFEI